MVQTLSLILALLISYLIGSFPTAFLFAKALKGIDIRQFGSKNVGATNALRLLGKGPGLTVLFIDILKGLFVTTILADYFLTTLGISLPSKLFFRLCLGLAAIIGHAYPLTLGFKGGKGVATSFGVLIGLSLANLVFVKVLGLVALAWLLTFILTKYVSLSSIIATLVFPLAVYLFIKDSAIFIITLAISIFVVFRHKSNIIRLLRKEETRLNIFRKP